MPRIAVFVSDELRPQAKQALSDFDVFEASAPEEVLRNCEALLAWPSKVSASLVTRMEHLRVIQSMSAGVDALPFPSIGGDVAIFSNAGAYAEPVAEHAWGIALGVAKGVHARKTKVRPIQLRGKTLVVLGAGAIGSEVARLAKSSLSMRTIGVSRSFKRPEFFDEVRPLASLESVLGAADLVVNSLPLTKETRGRFGYEALMGTRDAVIVVNVGRAETMPIGAVSRWLRERGDSRFATDVFWEKDGKEDFDTDLWTLPNFAGTLHISGLPLGDPWVIPQVAAAENLARFLKTGQASNQVDVGDYFRD